MNSHEIAAAVMSHYSSEYGNYAHFQCDCGYDEGGQAYTFVGLEDAIEITARTNALVAIISHAEYDHVSPRTVLVIPPAVAVNIVKFDRS